MYACLSVCNYIAMYLCAYVRVCVRVQHTHVFLYVHTNVRRYIQTLTYMYACILKRNVLSLHFRIRKGHELKQLSGAASFLVDNSWS